MKAKVKKKPAASKSPRRKVEGFVINSSIPAPCPDKRLGRRFLGRWGRLFAAMRVGDSVAVKSRSDMVALNTHARRCGMFTVSRGEAGGRIRVWKLPASAGPD